MSAHSVAKEVVRRGMKKKSSAKGAVAAAMREVHKDEPSTVTRAKHFGPGGKEAMLRAIAFSKARKAGHNIPKP